MDIVPNKRIGPYEIGRTLGDGGSCKVKLAYDTNNDNKKVAIKIMNMDLSLEVRKQLEMEIKAMMYLKHQHVLEILAHGT